MILKKAFEKGGIALRLRDLREDRDLTQTDLVKAPVPNVKTDSGAHIQMGDSIKKQ